MTADLVAGGLGGDGPIVTAGLGTSSPAAPGAIRATLVGAGTLTATLTDANATGPDPTVGSIARLGGWAVPPPVTRPADIAATLTGGSSLTANLTGIDRDAETVLLLLDLELMLTEGAML